MNKKMEPITSRRRRLPAIQVSWRIFVVVILWFLQGSGPVFAETFDLYVTDALTIPNKAVQLQARLTERKNQRSYAMSGEELEFFVQSRPVGRTKTDDDGWARIEYAPKMRGNLELLVKRITPSKVDAVKAKGRLLSWERRRPILVVDLAVLFRFDRKENPVFRDPRLALGEPQESASTELGKLAEYYYNLVYLDLTGKGEVEAFQLWLRKHHFPPGRIQILPDSSSALPDILQQLKEEGWENVNGGIGQTAAFAEVLVKNRLKAIIVGTEIEVKGLPRRAILLPDWSRIRRHL